MKRLAFVFPVCALGVKAWNWPYWFSVVSVARSLLQPPMKAETEADYAA